MIEPRLHASVFFRTILLQACWSFRGMQNLGFLLGIEPFLRRSCGGGAEFRLAAARHMEYFNTHPYMAGLVLGVVGAMEERRAGLSGEERARYEARIAGVKKAMGAALAAIGDSFFWGTLRPACGAAAALVWLVLWTAQAPHPVFFGAAFYLAAHNAPALWARWEGIRQGYELGEALPAKLEKLDWRRKDRRLRRAGLAAALTLLLSSWIVPPMGGAANESFVFFDPKLVAVFAAALGLRAHGFTSVKIYAVAAALGILAASAGL